MAMHFNTQHLAGYVGVTLLKQHEVNNPGNTSTIAMFGDISVLAGYLVCPDLVCEEQACETCETPFGDNVPVCMDQEDGLLMCAICTLGGVPKVTTTMQF